MIRTQKSISSINFDGLTILDYTAGLDLSSSFAVVTVPPGAKHKEAYSKRSDKYYFVATGRVHFMLEGTEHILNKGDFCFIPKGERYSYMNKSDMTAELVHIHTPNFSFGSEVFVGY